MLETKIKMFALCLSNWVYKPEMKLFIYFDVMFSFIKENI